MEQSCQGSHYLIQTPPKYNKQMTLVANDTKNSVKIISKGPTKIACNMIFIYFTWYYIK